MNDEEKDFVLSEAINVGDEFVRFCSECRIASQLIDKTQSSAAARFDLLLKSN